MLYSSFTIMYKGVKLASRERVKHPGNSLVMICCGGILLLIFMALKIFKCSQWGMTMVVLIIISLMVKMTASGFVALSVLSFMPQCVRGFEGAQAAGGWQMPRAWIKRSKHLMMRLPANEERAQRLLLCVGGQLFSQTALLALVSLWINKFPNKKWC